MQAFDDGTVLSHSLPFVVVVVVFFPLFSNSWQCKQITMSGFMCRSNLNWAQMTDQIFLIVYKVMNMFNK